MLENFTLETIDTGEAVIRLRRGGSGPPLLLLHGHPQTHVMWHKIAPRLARDFTVVAADLRGYGGSSKPPSTPDHAAHSKRATARDQVALMRKLGFESFFLAGHDRGGRCAHRMALDHPERVQKLAVLDIIPTREAFARANKDFAMGYYHWFFLSQPFDLPERLIGADPEYYYRWHTRTRGAPPDFFTPEADADYLAHFRDPGTVHAICEDYRAATSIDLVHDDADFGRRKLDCPVLALWGGQGRLQAWYDVLAVWRDYAKDVRGHAIDCGHYLAEEQPDETYEALVEFFGE